MSTIKNTLILCLIISSISCTKVPPPVAVGPVPNENQLAWQEMEFYGFIHFSMNTFTNIEWGYGDKSPELFNPEQLDARQWARVAKEAGMKGLILTFKHHDGFCLWPSEYTDYSVKNSKWKDGKGDVVAELAAACKEYGLKLGVYISPWDRNHPDYGKPEYIDYFRNQLREVLTNYGDVFEVWFDGANGGDGYYGGANDVRKVDKKSYYDWENTYKIIRELQPKAVIFSDAGPDVRWVGNEHGFAYETTWSPLLRDSVYGGMPEYHTTYADGQENGTHWVPAESDVSIRPGWYYHEHEDDKVKSLEQLLDIYYKSVGQNSTFLLNLPVDNRGLVHENDERQLKKLAAQLKRDFANDLVQNQNVSASNVRGDSKTYRAENTLDGDKNTYWATDDGVIQASITIDFQEAVEFNRFLVQEYISLGQRVKKFSVEAEVNGKWEKIGDHTTIGYKRILRFENTTSSKIRLNIEDAKACPLISNIQVFKAPVIVDSPLITRSKDGNVSLTNPDKGVDVYYSTDGSEPTLNSTKYVGPFEINSPTTIKAFSFEAMTKRKSDISTKEFDISKKDWKVVRSQNEELAINAIDDNTKTEFKLNGKKPSIIINLNQKQDIHGFSYTPSQRKYVSGYITHYTFYGSNNGRLWKKLSSGEFSNIAANPIQQDIRLQEKTSVKYIKLVAEKSISKKGETIIAEIGLITKK